MFFAPLSEQEQKDLAKSLVLLLSKYKYISDSYIIEFFSENLWETLPVGWQKALGDLSPPQIAQLLLDRDAKKRIYPSVWPLSLLALRATSHALVFPRMPPGHRAPDHVAPVKPEEFLSNSSQSSLLGHIFRKHVKPKKQHEIRKLGLMVKQLCDQTHCSSVVDVGSGQGHLTRFLSFGLGLDVTGIEADTNLVSMASIFDQQLLSTLAKERQKSGTSRLPHVAPGPAPRHVVGWVSPRATWQVFLQQLGRREKDSESYPAGPCQKRQRVLVSGQECELEKDIDHGSQHFCTEECSFVACATEQPAATVLQQCDAGNSSQSNIVITQPQLPNAFVLNHPYKVDNGNTMKESPVGEIPSAGTRQDSAIHPNSSFGIKEASSSNFVLTGLHACGDLSATLLRHFANCPYIQGITSVACCYMKITTMENPMPPGVMSPPLFDHPKEESLSEYGYPMSEWVRGLPRHQLSYKAREGACHALEDYLHRLREESGLLKTHCYRAALESIIRAEKPHLRRASIQTIKKAHMLSFAEYARLGLPRVGLPGDLPIDPVHVGTMLKQQDRVIVFFSLALLLAPVVETLLLLDRMLFLQERGFQSQLAPLFDPALSPRNLVLVAVKKADEEAC
ncbi:protein RRNAD1 isoform X1 [Electrophorus electricus]|uniref:protein RRNAD1 isoform X1 n=1 Tax=Electrophorus electricus TaxID=8005 RepID=UPI0015D09AA3|nr:protein RRNAD1 isoform X1 [Electrophorus electricus]